MAERARRSVGATVQACRQVLGGAGLAANLAGGTHHAYADKGSGFCVFNDAAVAARLGPNNAQHATRPTSLCQVIITPYSCACLHTHTTYCCLRKNISLTS